MATRCSAQRMREKCSSLLDLVLKRLSLARTLKPRMLVSDHFASLRNEIDLETEIRLIEIEEKPDKRDQAWDHNAYNSARQSMIDELKLQESELLSSLKQPSEFEAFAKNLLRVEEKVREIETAVEKRQANDWSNLKRLTRVYLEIEDLLDAFRSKALNNKTFIFKADFLNPLGALIVFEDVYLNEAESMFIKNKLSNGKRPMPLSEMFQYIEHVRFDGIESCKQLACINRTFSKATLVISKFTSFVNANRVLLADQTVIKIDRAVLEQSPRIGEQNDPSSASLRFFGAIEHLELNSGRLSKIAAGSFEYLKTLSVLLLNSNRIRSLDKSMFSGLDKLKNLGFIGNKLKRLEISCFDELPELTTLLLNANEFESLTPRQFSSLVKLKSLNLSANKIARVDVETESANVSPFLNMDSLSELQLNGNRISSVTGWFDGLPSLKNLNLMSNQLEELAECLLNPNAAFTSLETLNLGINRIRRIDDQVFRNLGNLKTLQLNNNRLTAVNECFQHLYNLRKLVLKANLIERISLSAFRQLLNLNYLDLSMNRIKSLDEGIFESLGKLDSLNLSNNQLSHLTSGHLKGLGQLKSLNLSLNRISFDSLSDDDVFQHLTSLNDLNLANNEISRVTRSLFGPGLKQLETLSLSSNQIAEIDERAFQNLKSLLNLNIDYNRLRAISMQMFQGLDNLKTLYLSSNSISCIPEFAFINLLQLYNLAIDVNFIESISPNAFNCLFNLHFLNLSNNRIERLEDRVFECLTKLNDLVINRNEISSIGPDTFLGLESISTIILTQNKLESIDENAFKHTPNLFQLILSNNCLKSFNLKALKSLGQLNHLDVSYNQIEALDDEPSDYEKLSTLSFLSLNGNPIRFIRPDTFRYLVALSQLYVISGKLADLDEHFMDSFHSLNGLSLSMNHLRRFRIPRNASQVHAAATELSSLNLTDNKLRQLEPGQFERLRLGQLELKGNKLVEIGPGLLKDSNALRTLTLSSNCLRKIDAKAFNEAANLSTIHLGDNCLRGLETNTLVQLKNLVTLAMSGNLVARISDVFRFADFAYNPLYFPAAPATEFFDEFEDDFAFDVQHEKNRFFSQFIFLDLASNYIRDLDDLEEIRAATNNYNLFGQLTNLNLSRNLLGRFRPEALHGSFERLNQLALGFNEIERLETAPGARVRGEEEEGPASEACLLPSITNFNAEHNRIKSIDKDFFAVYMACLRSIDLNRNEIETLDESVFECLDGVTQLDLSYNKLTRLDSPKYFSSALGLLTLKLSNNQLEALHPDLLHNQNKLTTLALNHNRLRSLPNGLFTNAHILKVLNLSGNCIERLDESIFANQKQLDLLNLSSNKLTSLAFLAGLSSLRMLRLSDNLIEELDGSHLAGLAVLGELNLASNKIKRIGSDAFAALGRLTTLVLNKNCIVEIERDSFSPLTLLCHLDLSSNSLVEINPDRFRCLKKLRALNLAENPFRAVDSAQTEGSSFLSHLKDLTCLDHITLSQVNLGRFFSSGFFSLSKDGGVHDDSQPLLSFKRLDLDRCELEDLGIGAFASLSLEELTLSNNKLQALDSRAFEGLGRLTTLDLSKAVTGGVFDKLVADDVRPFNGLVHLNKLLLRGNHVHKMNGGLLAGLVKLTHLDLAENSIENLENPFESLTRLETLHLEKNRLTRLSHSWLQKLGSLKTLDLSANQITVLETDNSDTTTNQPPFLHNESLTSLNLSSNLLRRISREHFKNLRNLVRLDLSANKIDEMDETAFEETAAIVSLNLSRNELKQVSTTMFEKLERLETLDLAENKIERFLVVDHDRSPTDERDNLRLFEDLVTLNLVRNKLRELDVVGLNLDESRSLASLHLNGNELGNQEKLARDLSKIRTLELLDLAGNAGLNKIKTSWMMLDLNRLKYLHFDGQVENDLVSTQEHRDAFFLNLFNVQRDMVFQDDRYRESIARLKTANPHFNDASLYLTERALKSFS